MKQVAWFTVVILTTLTVVFLVWELRTTVLLFILSVVVAAAIRPIVDYFLARGWSRGTALLISYGICVGIIISFGIIFGAPFFVSSQQLIKDLASGYEQILTQWPDGTLFQRLAAQGLAVSTDLLETLSEAQINGLIQFFLGAALGSFDLLGQLGIVLVLSLYWSADQERFKRLWLSILPVDVRTRAREIWQQVETDLGAYLRSELMQSLIAIVLLGMGYQLMGLKYPIVLSVIGAIVWLVPWVGVLLAVIPVLIVGILTSPLMALMATIWTILVLAVLEFIVEPRIFNSQRYNSSLTIVMIIVMASLYGIMGILFAIPLAAAIQIIATRLMHPITPTVDVTSHPSLQVQDLQERLQSVQELLIQPDKPPRPEIITLVERLAKLIERADAEN